MRNKYPHGEQDICQPYKRLSYRVARYDADAEAVQPGNDSLRRQRRNHPLAKRLVELAQPDFDIYQIPIAPSFQIFLLGQKQLCDFPDGR